MCYRIQEVFHKNLNSIIYPRIMNTFKKILSTFQYKYIIIEKQFFSVFSSFVDLEAF